MRLIRFVHSSTASLLCGLLACSAAPNDTNEFSNVAGTSAESQPELAVPSELTDAPEATPGVAADVATPEPEPELEPVAALAVTTAFKHPGILVNRGMLDFVKARIGSAPYSAALSAAKGSRLGTLSYVPHPYVTVECGSYSNPDNGCSEEKDDSAAAYTHALLWYHTGNAAYAKKAIEIMNAWSAKLKSHTNSNAPLQAAWAAEVFPRAAEIIRYTYTGWAAADVTRFSSMLKNAYLPLLINGSSSNGNWELSMIEAVMNIGVFNDDAVTFEKGVKMWRERVPAYIYIPSDGPTPVPPPRGKKTGSALIGFWYNQSTFQAGLMQESCRDLGHAQYGLAAIINAGETAKIQGIDLLGEQEERIRNALGFHAKYLNGAAVPSWLCGGKLNDLAKLAMWEIGFNYYGTYLGRGMSNTQQLVLSRRPSGADHHMVWETLTHGGIGGAGL